MLRRSGLLAAHWTYRRHNTHPKNPARDPALKPIWQSMQREMDGFVKQKVVHTRVSKHLEKVMRKQYQTDEFAARLAADDQRIVERHEARALLQLRREARMEHQLREEERRVEFLAARGEVEFDAHRTSVQKTQKKERQRLRRSLPALMRLEKDSRSFVTLENVEAHVGRELQKTFAGDRVFVNAFGMPVLPEGPPPPLTSSPTGGTPPLPEINNHLELMEV